MDFRKIDTNDLTYKYPELSEQSPRWETCDKSDECFISLKTTECRSIDIYKITIQLIKEPAFQMRITAEIWCPKLLSKMRAAGFEDYSVPFATGRGENRREGEIDVECFCDFGEDTESQKNAKLFLATLLKYSHSSLNLSLATYPPNREAVATAIDNLAEKHGMTKPNFGSNWTLASADLATRFLKFFSSAFKTQATNSRPAPNPATSTSKPI